MIRRQDDGYWYFDLGSVNGSLMNGRRVTAPIDTATIREAGLDEMRRIIHLAGFQLLARHKEV